MDVHQEYATDVHQKCARHVHQECATYVHRKCTADVQPKCTTCPSVQSLPRGLPGQALEQDGKRDSIAESTRQDQSRRSLRLSQ